jgi:hypothetical protein
MRERIRPKWTRNYDARSQQWALMEFAEGDSRETSFHFSEHWWSHSALQQGSAMLWVRSWFFQFLEVLVRYSEAIKRLMSEMSRKAIKQGARRRSQICQASWERVRTGGGPNRSALIGIYAEKQSTKEKKAAIIRTEAGGWNAREQRS